MHSARPTCPPSAISATTTSAVVRLPREIVNAPASGQDWCSTRTRRMYLAQRVDEARRAMPEGVDARKAQFRFELLQQLVGFAVG